MDVTSLPKNGPINTRTNFRPISFLPTVSELFERIMDKQIVAYNTPFLFPLLSLVLLNRHIRTECSFLNADCRRKMS